MPEPVKQMSTLKRVLYDFLIIGALGFAFGLIIASAILLVHGS